MALVYLAVSFLASLAVSISVYEAYGSLVLGLAAYATIGILVLSSVLVAAAIRETADKGEPRLFPAE